MQIKDPKFKEGQKVRDIEDGTIFTLININSYGFDYDEYWYNLECDGLTWARPESKLEPYQEKPKTIWGVKEGDEFYYIAFDGDILSGKWVDAIEYRESGNVFLTLQEAESELERRKIEAEMLRLGGRRNFKFDGDNYGIYYCDGINVVYYCNIVYQGLIYFDTTKDAHDAIEKIGEDRLKKYIFGVES